MDPNDLLRLLDLDGKPPDAPAGTGGLVPPPADAGPTALDVDAFGNIRNWPQGFFGDEMEDLVARTKAQSKRTAGAAETRR